MLSVFFRFRQAAQELSTVSGRRYLAFLSSYKSTVGYLALTSMEMIVASRPSFNNMALFFLYLEESQYAGIPVNEPNLRDGSWSKSRFVCRLPFPRKEVHFFPVECTSHV